MKKRVAIGVMAALVICSCQVNEENELAPEGKTFTATMEDMVDDAVDVATKTFMDSDGNVRWKRGDQVSIFAGRNINEQYQIADAYDGRAEAALNPVSSPGFVSSTSIDNNVAFYPYSSTAILDKSGNTYVINGIDLPATQTYAESSFGNGAFPMVAVTSSTNDYNLKFKNVLGGLKLQLKGTAIIRSISFIGNNNEKLCGAADVTVSNSSAPSIILTDATATTVTLNCDNGVQLNANTATAFIIALPPIMMTKGFTVTVTDSNNGQMEIKTAKRQTITRSNLLSMPVVNYEGTMPVPEAVDLGLPSGLKWASFNLGANAPEENGDYYAWGETELHYSNQDPLTWKDNKIGYYWTNYEFRTSGDSYDNVKFSKYNTLSSFGAVDNKTVLDPEDDTATVNWGGSWRIPTIEEWKELLDECTWTWTTQNGVNGRLVTGPNGNSIFLPAAGWLYNMLNFSGDLGYYWSTSLYLEAPAYSWNVYFRNDIAPECTFDGRYHGFSVRPVTDEGVRISVTGISLNMDNLDLIDGDTASLTVTVTPPNATQSNVIWSSSDNTVATVDYTGKVTAVASGTATITAKTYDGGYTATCQVTVIAAPEAVDLGLTSGLKWASFNVGASAPEEYGDYFAWGETEPYYEDGYAQSSSPVWKSGKSEGYYWPSYSLCNGSYVSQTKYCTKEFYGIVDNNTELDPENDAASVNWGSSWRMPTDADWTELRTECTWTWTKQNGVNGRLVTSNTNGNSIFLPAAGYWYGAGLYTAGSDGYYWSSSLNTGSPYRAYNVSFVSDKYGRSNDNRFLGRSVRAVTE